MDGGGGVDGWAVGDGDGGTGEGVLVATGSVSVGCGVADGHISTLAGTAVTLADADALEATNPAEGCGKSC